MGTLSQATCFISELTAVTGAHRQPLRERKPHLAGEALMVFLLYENPCAWYHWIRRAITGKAHQKVSIPDAGIGPQNGQHDTRHGEAGCMLQ